MKPKALLLLGSNFFMHVVSRVTFTYDRGGERRFRANFDHQGLLSVDGRGRELLPAWQRCVACGLCDAVCPELLGGVAEGRFVGPQAVASGMVRDLSTQAHNAEELQALARCEGCTECEGMCPVGIPLRDLAGWLTELGVAAREATSVRGHLGA